MNQFLKNTFVVAFTLLTVTTFAQKKMSNGIIKYEITDIQGDNPQMSMLKGTMFNMAFLGSKQKMDIGIMGGLMRVQTIVDATDPAKTTVLMDMMGQKMLIPISKEEMAAMEVTSNENHLWLGFVAGVVAALIMVAIASCINRRSRRHDYESIRPINGWQEYQHYSRNSVKDVTSITGNKSISAQGRAVP